MHHFTSTSSRSGRIASAAMAAALLGGLLVVSAATASATPTTFTVDTLTDAVDAAPGNGVCETAGSTCTLRAAIQEANAAAGSTIAFSVTGSIRPTTKLPSITSPTTIDGSSAPGYAPATGPVIRITCDDAPDVADGLTVTAPDTTIRALEIDGCTTGATFVHGADDGRVFGSWFGADNTPRSYPHNGLHGILSDADGIQIGGSAAGEANVINAQDLGISARDTVADGIPNHITILGNRIGSKPDGGPGLDFSYGVDIEPNVGAVIGGPGPGLGNLISGGTIGIGYVDTGIGIVIQGNRIGTNAAGTAADPNNGGITGGAAVPRTGNQVPLIGGSDPGAGNLISGNHYHGIRLTSRATVQGNLIGTDVTGTAALPNGGAGSFQDHAIELIAQDGATTAGTLIGGTGSGEGNVISGNTAGGIHLDGGGYQILGNLIGTDITGTQPLPNDGPNIVAAGSDNGPGQIGGVGPGEANTIANSPEQGVLLDARQDPITGVTIRGNRITANAGLSIDLLQHAASGGGNGDQLPPTITTVTPSGGSTEVSGTVTSSKPGPLLVDVYASDVCQAAWGTGEAKEHLGTIVVPYAGGNVSTAFSGSVAASTSGSVITATTTQSANGTSQFSKCGPYTDLQVTTRTNRAEATMGDEVGAEVRITNGGTDPIAGLAVPLSIPSGIESAVEVPIVEASQGTVQSGTWTIGSLAPGASVTACVRGEVTRTVFPYDYFGQTRYAPTTFGSGSDTSAVDVPDPYRGNDSSSTKVDIVQGPTPNPAPPDPAVCPPASITVDDAAAVRPSSGTGPISFTVRLSKPEPRTVTVAFRTVPGSAIPVDDYLTKTGTLIIPAGQVSATIPVSMQGGQTDEPQRSFTVVLSTPKHATLADATATGTIQANHLLAGCPAGSGTNKRFVCHLYADALGRAPDSGGVAYWSGKLASGMRRSAIARSFLSEPEALRKVADRPYVRYIGRHGTTAELQRWADQFKAGTADAQDARIAILASATYWYQASSSNSVFVQHLYRDVFRRSADSGGVAYWSGRLAAGESRGTVALRFISESEGRRKIISDVYLRFLRREATSAEANQWVAQFAAGRTEVDVGIAVVASSEYLAR